MLYSFTSGFRLLSITDTHHATFEFGIECIRQNIAPVLLIISKTILLQNVTFNVSINKHLHYVRSSKSTMDKIVGD